MYRQQPHLLPCLVTGASRTLPWAHFHFLTPQRQQGGSPAKPREVQAGANVLCMGTSPLEWLGST